MDPEDIHDICFARYVLEAGAASELRVDDELLAELEEMLAAMSAAADEGDLEAVVSIDTRLHALVVERGGGRRVVELWHGLDSQMGSLMRSSLERQGIDLRESYERHRKYVDAFATRRRATIVKEIREHYLDATGPEE
jgi:DNA-binding GntR family transcriptional regulator